MTHAIVLTSRQQYIHDVAWATHSRLGPLGIENYATTLGVHFLRVGHSQTYILPDVDTLIGDFEELGAKPEHVGDAIASLVLNGFGIEHDVPTHGLTIAVCGELIK